MTSTWWQRFELGQRVRYFSERAGKWRDGEVRRIERWRCSNGEDHCSIEVARVEMGAVLRAWGYCFDESNREYLRTLDQQAA